MYERYRLYKRVLLLCRQGSVIADYTVVFHPEIAAGSQSDILQFIEETVIDSLSNAPFIVNGSVIAVVDNKEMGDQLVNQSNNLLYFLFKTLQLCGDWEELYGPFVQLNSLSKVV